LHCDSGDVGKELCNKCYTVVYPRLHHARRKHKREADQLAAAKEAIAAIAAANAVGR
jgi:hypothetical protein